MASQWKGWRNFCELEDESLEDIKSAWVFGPDGDEAFVITNDDQFFSIEINSKDEIIEPRIVEALCKKNVIDLAFGALFSLALTKEGGVLTWDNLGGKLKVEKCKWNLILNSKLVQAALGKRVVTTIACGALHCLVVTDDGEVFGWGSTEKGQLSNERTSTHCLKPKKINYAHATKHPMASAVQVVCAPYSSFLLLNSGEVISFGYNDQGQLGLGHNKESPTPKRVSIPDDKFITKIVCGKRHTLVMTNRGELYGWGSNAVHQLTGGAQIAYHSPVRVADGLGEIADVQAFWPLNISTAMARPSRTCYVWGECVGDEIFQDPLETQCKKLSDIFYLYAKVPIYPAKMEATARPSTIKDAFLADFENEMTSSSVTFLVEDREIHAHMDVLKIRCSHFRALLHDPDHEDDKPIRIANVSHFVFKAFLRYLYSDELELMSTKDAIELLDLAHEYAEDDLKEECAKLLIQGINAQNAALVFHVANHYKMKPLEEFTFKFCVDHMAEVVKTEAFANLDGSICKTFLAKAGSKKLFK